MAKPEFCKPKEGFEPLDPSFFPPESVRDGAPRASRMSRRRAIVLILVHVVIFAHLLHWQLAGETITPLEPSEAMFTLTQGVLNAGAVLLLLSLLATLVFGRFFCGWACHLVALQDLSAWILKKLGIRPRPLKSRFLMFVPLLAGLFMFFWAPLYNWVAGFARPEFRVEMTTAEFWKTFPGFWIGLVSFLVCGSVMVYLLGAKGFCAYACPYGGLFGVLDRVAPGRIVVNDQCRQCGHCTAVCTSNVLVHQEVRDYGKVMDPGCMKCLDCVSVCPENALSFGFSTPSLFTKKRVRTKTRRAWTFSGKEELALVLAFGFSMLVFRGLPQIAVKEPAYRVYDWAQNLYGEVPLLLGLSLAICTAFVLVVSARAVFRSDASFLGAPLKSAGKLTGKGKLFLGLASPWLLFVLHSAVVQWSMFQGHRLLSRADAYDPVSFAANPGSFAVEHPELLQDLGRAETSFETAENLGLFFDFRIRLARARIDLFQSEPELAAPRLREVIARNPAVPAPRVLLSRVLFVLGRPAEGCEEILAAGREAPEDHGLRAAFQQAVFGFLQAGRFPEAKPLLEKSVALWPDEVPLVLTLAEVEVRLGAPDQAFQVLRRSFDDPTAARHMAEFLTNAGDTNAAAIWRARAAATAPK